MNLIEDMDHNHDDDGDAVCTMNMSVSFKLSGGKSLVFSKFNETEGKER